MKRFAITATLAAFVTILVTGSAIATKAAQRAASQKAVCVLHEIKGSGISGTVTFTQHRGHVDVKAEVTGLTPGKHGFHIHEYGDCSAPDGTSAGGHHNPTRMQHGAPTAAKRHVGDLGNLEADENGKAVLSLKDRVIQLRGRYSIIGRAIIVHAKPDDFGQPTGNAGARVACGVIGLAKP